MKMDATVPPTDHSLPQLSICALVALLCRLFSTHCLAADVAFSNDNQRIYAVSENENDTKPALREIDLSTKSARVIRLVQLAPPESVLDVASGDGANILLITVKNLWAFDPRTSRATKLCSAPPGKPFGGVSYDPKSHAIYVTVRAKDELLHMVKNELYKVKNGHELVPVTVRRHDEISALVFSSEGELFYEESGELWRGKIASEEDSLWVEAER
jgi:DNA-binding beta-propeller fold protein YncE